jgi:hypothetical protein
MAQGFVLHDEISEAVKDGLAAVDLDAHENVRAVAGKSVRAGVNAAASEILDESGCSVISVRFSAVSQLLPIMS